MKQTVKSFYASSFVLDINNYLKEHKTYTVAMIIPYQDGFIVVFNTNS